MFRNTATRKRYLFAALLAVLILIVMPSVLRDSPETTEKMNPEEPAGERAAVQDFWIAYREATRQRIAGRPRQAAASYRRALQLQNQHEGALYYLGNMYVELGTFAAADSAWRSLIEVNPHSSRARMQLGNLYSTPELSPFFDLAAAEDEFRHALDINSEETGPYLSLGMVALLGGDLAEARRHFDAVIGSNFRSVEAHYLTGYIEWKRGHFQAAEAKLSQAIEYARPREVPADALGEGDTRTGRPLGATTTLGLGAFIREQLGELPAQDAADLHRELNTRYAALEDYLGAMPAGSSG